MNALKQFILEVLRENDPTPLSLDEIQALALMSAKKYSRSEIARCLSDLYLLDVVEPVRSHPLPGGYLGNVKLTEAGRIYHLRALAECEDLGDVSDHLLRGAL
jgi:hypothetical protein